MMKYSKYYILTLCLYVLTGCIKAWAQDPKLEAPPPLIGKMSRTSPSTDPNGGNGGNSLPQIKCLIKRLVGCGVEYGFFEYLEITPEHLPFLLKDLDIQAIGNNGQIASISNVQIYLVDPVFHTTGNINLTQVNLPYVVDDSWAYSTDSEDKDSPKSVYIKVTFNIEYCPSGGSLGDDYDFDFTLSGKYLDDEHKDKVDEYEAGYFDDQSYYTDDFEMITQFNVPIYPFLLEGDCSEPLDPYPNLNLGTARSGNITGGLDTDRWTANLYPNPTNSSTIVNLELNTSSTVEMGIYELSGRRVLAPERSSLESGLHKIKLQMDGLAPGIYLVKIQVGDSSKSLKLLKYTH